MEILILVASLLVLDLLANATGPNSRDIENALRVERVPVRRDAFLSERPDPRDWRY